jgi:hypothetical protein
MPYNIIKNGRKYELYLIDGNKLLGTHTSKKKAEEQIKAIEINKTGRKNPELYEKTKEIVKKIRKIKKNELIERVYKGKGQTNEPFKKIKIGNHIYTYYISDKPEKKLMTIVNGKKIYFGQTGYMHFRDKTGLLNIDLSHFDNDRRNRYIARASKIENKEGEYTSLNPESPNFHALNILW